MRILGFAQTMRLDGSTAEEGYEIKILLDSGVETSVPTDQATIMALTKLWADNRKTTRSLPRQSSQVESAPFLPPPPSIGVEDEDTEVFGGDPGEIVTSNVAAVVADEMGYPVPIAAKKLVNHDPLPPMPRPRFLEDGDEDGKQV